MRQVGICLLVQSSDIRNDSTAVHMHVALTMTDSSSDVMNLGYITSCQAREQCILHL